MRRVAYQPERGRGRMMLITIAREGRSILGGGIALRACVEEKGIN